MGMSGYSFSCHSRVPRETVFDEIESFGIMTKFRPDRTSSIGLIAKIFSGSLLGGDERFSGVLPGARSDAVVRKANQV
jgi:hypothetical protein